jgi:hypothetical protein
MTSMNNMQSNVQQQVQTQQFQQANMPPQMPPMVPAPAPAPALASPYPQGFVKPSLKDKTQSKVFSTIVKALCLLVLLAGFLPFATVSCGPMVSVSVSGYDLAFGGASDDAAELSQGNMGLGMGMGAGQLAALNMLAGVNLLLVAAFAGTALLLVLSFVLGRTKLELMLSLVVAAFSLAAYLQWLGIFSAFTDMFARASEMGGEMMSAGPDIGLYAVIAFTSLLLLTAGLEAVGKMPAFLTKGEEEGGGVYPVPQQQTSVASMPYPLPVQGQPAPPAYAPVYSPAPQSVQQSAVQPIQEQEQAMPPVSATVATVAAPTGELVSKQESAQQPAQQSPSSPQQHSAKHMGDRQAGNPNS